MEVHLAEQTASFIYAAVLGLCLGGGYDVFRCLRVLFRRRWVTALCDLLFAFLCMSAYFLFSMIATGGVLRSYTALGAILAMFLYFTGLSPLLMALLLPVMRFMRRAVCAAAGWAAKGVRWLWHKLRPCFEQDRGNCL